MTYPLITSPQSTAERIVNSVHQKLLVMSGDDELFDAVEDEDLVEVLTAAVQHELDKDMKPSPLLQCIDCKNTESPAGAMARYFNQGRCLHCGGWFKVVRA